MADVAASGGSALPGGSAPPGGEPWPLGGCAAGNLGSGGDGSGRSAIPFGDGLRPLAAGIAGATCALRFSLDSGPVTWASAPTAASVAAAPEPTRAASSGSEPVRRCLGMG